MFDLYAFALFVAYASVLFMLWYYRHDIADWIKPIGIVLIPYLLTWTLFYGLIPFFPPEDYRSFYVHLSRFGNTTGAVFLWVLILRFRQVVKERA